MGISMDGTVRPARSHVQSVVAREIRFRLFLLPYFGPKPSDD